MILTEGAAKGAEGFLEYYRKGGFEPFELTEGEQLNLLFITQMYQTDKVFKEYLQGCVTAYASKFLEGRDSLSTFLTNMQKIV